MTINQEDRIARDHERGISLYPHELRPLRDLTLIGTSAVGAAFAVICCMMPLLAVVFGAVGLTALLAKADYVLIPALIICLGLIGVRLYRERARQDEAHG